MNKVMTTVDWIISTWIIPPMNHRDRIYYSAPHIIKDLINKGELTVNGNKIENIYHVVCEGDIVCYNGHEHCFLKSDLLCAWLGGKL